MAVDLQRAWILIGRALADGAMRPSPSRVEWNIAGACVEPSYREIGGHQPQPIYSTPEGSAARRALWQPGQPSPMWLGLWLPCRRCKACLRYRRWQWRCRAERELRVASRTWFGTLTLSPESHYLMMARAGVDTFAGRHREASKEVTKFLKRVRKNTGAPLRYLIVCEEHKQKLAGLPHYHLLVHQSDPLKPVTYRDLAGQWKWGFSNFKLVDDGELTNQQAAGYVTKYLVKSMSARVRASIDYGFDRLIRELEQ